LIGYKKIKYPNMTQSEITKVNFLKNLDLYEGLSDDQICCVAENSVDRDYSTGEQIYTPYEQAGYIYIVKKGEVELYHNIDGKKVVFNVLTPGSVFGCFQPDNKVPNHFAQCTKSCYLCTTPVDEFLKLVQIYPEMMLKLMQKMASRMNEYEEKLEVSFGNASTKILYELRRLQEKRQKGFLGKIFNIPLRMTHEEISKITGLNRVTVTKTMQELIKQGKIQIDETTGGMNLQTM
jgi:CRP-like cAMP-binding protein